MEAYIAINAIPPVAPVAAAPVNSAATTNAATTFEQVAELTAQEQLLATDQTSATNSLSAVLTPTPSSEYAEDGVLDATVLANLSPQALTLLNEAETGQPLTTNSQLSSVQLQELTTLAQDAQMLNETQLPAVPVVNIPVPESAATATVNLTAQAATLINETNALNNNSAALPTAAQLQQIAGVLTPFVNQTLTPDVFTQIQAALTSAGINPVTLSLQTYMLSMNYLSGELPAIAVPEGEQVARNESTTTEFAEPEEE